MWQFQRYWQRVRTGLSGYIRVRSVPSQFLKCLPFFGLVFLSCVFGSLFLYFDFFPGKFFRERSSVTKPCRNGARCRPTVTVIGGAWRYLRHVEQNIRWIYAVHDHAGDQGLFDRHEGKCGPSMESAVQQSMGEAQTPFQFTFVRRQIHWFRGHVFPNGYSGRPSINASDTPPGYGLAKLDKIRISSGPIQLMLTMTSMSLTMDDLCSDPTIP